MKKWLFRIGIAAMLVLLVPAIGLLLNVLDYQAVTRHTTNEQLETIRPDWPGNAIDQSDRFMDERTPFLPQTLDLLKWKLGGNKFEEAKRNDVWKLAVKDPSEFLSSDADGILWLGHASFYIRLGGVGILTDPVFGDPAILNRFVGVPSPLEQIRNVEYVLLSHDHRDHMDETTLRAIAQRFPSATFLAGLRSDDVLKEWTTPTNRVGTAGWFQRFEIGASDLDIYFHPVRHWSRRWLFDTNWRLWGSYVIRHGDTTIYFGGDSGYSAHYRELGELFPNVDYLLIGIGAYEPRWFMEANHNNPTDVIKALIDSGAQTLIPMHYGTFDLSDEPPGTPLTDLFTAADANGLRERIRPLAMNESIGIK